MKLRTSGWPWWTLLTLLVALSAWRFAAFRVPPPTTCCIRNPELPAHWATPCVWEGRVHMAVDELVRIKRNWFGPDVSGCHIPIPECVDL